MPVCLFSLTVQQQTQLWTEKSGVVGNYFGDELYTEMLSVQVARDNTHPSTCPPSMVHCLADFWQAVAAIIRLHTDQDVSPPRWTPHALYDNLNLTAATAHATLAEDNVGGDRVHMIVLPDCQDLYEYGTFTTLLAAVEFSKELCLHLGRHFTLTAFHPHFKNSPKFFSPERHAPFPTVGLQLSSSLGHGKDADLPLGVPRRSAPVEQSKTTDNGKILPHPEGPAEDDEIGALADARIRNLDETRAHFEVLFNSAAAVEQQDAAAPSFPARSEARRSTLTTTADSKDDGIVSEEEQLAHTFRQERQRRRGNYPPAMVRQLIALWMDEQRYADSSKRQLNPALEFMDTIDGYTVCTQKMGELVYAEIWQAIRQVYETGVQADSAQQGVADNKPVPPPTSAMPEDNNKANRFDLSKWMHSLSNEKKTKPKRGNDKNNGGDDELPPVTSTLFIATKFNTYNAQAFKRFAITINAALKRITGGRMFLEVFHPEYVGNQGYDHALRRSPFPMIQICYLVQPADDNTKAP